tara:strand:- start:364 stop:963 length:600 start_codon:yes stop_codon:yes gene_type:complete
MEKLIKIQSELKAPKNQYNAFGKYKYRNCEDILEAVKPLLESQKCTLVLTDQIKEVANVLFVEAKAIFSDGDSKIEVCAQAGIDINRKGMDIAQSFGSSSSYARKYALNGLFLIDDTKDADSTNNHDKRQETPNNAVNKGKEIFLNEKEFELSKKAPIEKITNLLKKYDGKTLFTDGNIYSMTIEQFNSLKKIANNGTI